MVLLGRRGLIPPAAPPIVIPPVYHDEVLADSPIGYWRLGEPSGTNANDEGSGNHDGTYVNSPALAEAGALIGDADTAVLFSGAPGEYVNVAGYTTVPATPSIEAWVKGTAADLNDMGLAGWYDSGAVANCFLYLSSSGTLTRFYIGNTANDVTFDSTGLFTGGWHHIVGTYDGTAARLYFDGALVVGPITKTAAGGTPAAGKVFQIADYGDSGSDFNGTIDEVAVYGTALSAARILAHYRAAGY